MMKSREILSIVIASLFIIVAGLVLVITQDLLFPKPYKNPNIHKMDTKVKFIKRKTFDIFPRPSVEAYDHFGQEFKYIECNQHDICLLVTSKDLMHLVSGKHTLDIVKREKEAIYDQHQGKIWWIVNGIMYRKRDHQRIIVTMDAWTKWMNFRSYDFNNLYALGKSFNPEEESYYFIAHIRNGKMIRKVKIPHETEITKGTIHLSSDGRTIVFTSEQLFCIWKDFHQKHVEHLDVQFESIGNSKWIYKVEQQNILMNIHTNQKQNIKPKYQLDEKDRLWMPKRIQGPFIVRKHHMIMGVPECREGRGKIQVQYVDRL